MPKVSVILPIYNVEKYLRKCLDSVINQTLKDIEIICINDCSADNCENIILEYAKKDGRIKIINNEKNYGIGFSRNIGINESSGEYISFIDADDYIEKDYIEILYNTAIKNKADIVFTNNINIVRDKIIKPYYHNRINIWKKKFKETSIKLAHNDTLFLFTDGAYEIFDDNNKMLGDEKMKVFLKKVAKKFGGTK